MRNKVLLITGVKLPNSDIWTHQREAHARKSQSESLEKHSKYLIHTAEKLEKMLKRKEIQKSTDFESVKSRLESCFSELESNGIITKDEKSCEKDYYREISTSLQKEISMLKSQVESLNRETMKLDNCHKLIEALKERVSPIYNQYFYSQTEWMAGLWDRKYELLSHFCNEEFAEIILQVDFLGHMLLKTTSDTNWLLEQISDLNRCDVGRSKSQNSFHRKVKKDVKTTSHALEDFELARNELLQQFIKTDKRNI